MYKLVAIDMDGTLLNDQHEVTMEVHEALQEAKKRGVKIVLCTGRPINGVYRYLEELVLNEDGDFVIAFNGALVQNAHTNEVVSQLSLTHDDFIDLHQLSLTLETPMHYFDAENLYTSNRDISNYTVLESYMTKMPLHYRTVDEIPQEVLIPKIMYIDEPARLSETIDNVPEEWKKRYTMVQSAPYFYEILHPEASKGNAVKQLAEQLGIKQEEVMAIGDNGNDLSMIQYAGCGVAMENAIPAIKEAADYITTSNNAHGVAEAIREKILKVNEA
ncbi:sugar-phosphatase [Terribacillus halophilus]|jgi:Cof subfamily protein (haloacid dehalogenase superfamily)|uniref:sugar-phosphatase n=1 Tax=Terribacillus halophilus TaxID=361279 RepID=UPI000987433A|nr:sugar-phosphatase [Terribacillus halophilus]